MLGRVEMDVVDMPVQVCLVSDNMVPKTILPHSAGSHIHSSSPQAPEAHLDSLKQIRNVVLFGIDDHVEVVRQDDPGHYVKGHSVIYRIQ